MVRLIVFILLIQGPVTVFSQGHIDHIKNQSYLKYRNSVDCSDPADNLSMRICANLWLQRSDSTLTVVYNQLLLTAKNHTVDSLEMKIIRMQTTWRTLRDQHCQLLADTYEGGSLQPTVFMSCMKDLTDNRTSELMQLKRELGD